MVIIEFGGQELIKDKSLKKSIECGGFRTEPQLFSFATVSKLQPMLFGVRETLAVWEKLRNLQLASSLSWINLFEIGFHL